MKLRSSRFLSIAAMAVASVCGGPAFGNSISTPTGLTSSSAFYVLFVTNTTTTASSSDLSVYDNIAQTDANNNGLGSYNSQSLNWKVVGSSTNSPPGETTVANDRLPSSNIPVYLPDGTLVASSVSDLWGTGAVNPVDEMADGTIINSTNLNSTDLATYSKVWTGTSSNGDKAAFFPEDLDFTFGGVTDGPPPIGHATSTEYGQSMVTGTEWIDAAGSDDQSELHPIYAFAGINIPATSTVPLPSSAAMGAVAASLLAAYAAGRKLVKLRMQ